MGFNSGFKGLNISYHIIHHITSYHVMSCHVMSHHITSRHVTSYHISHHILLYIICHVMSYHISCVDVVWDSEIIRSWECVDN